MGALSSLTGGGGLSGSGGAATGTSGDSKGGSVGGARGISSPIVFGGFKSDGDASVGNIGQTVLIGVGLLIVGVLAYRLLVRR